MFVFDCFCVCLNMGDLNMCVVECLCVRCIMIEMLCGIVIVDCDVVVVWCDVVCV